MKNDLDSGDTVTATGNIITLGKWYTVKVVYTDTSTTDETTSTTTYSGKAQYYLDGTLITTNTTKMAPGLNHFYMVTSTSRQAIVSIDDIKILSLD